MIILLAYNIFYFWAHISFISNMEGLMWQRNSEINFYYSIDDHLQL